MRWFLGLITEGDAAPWLTAVTDAVEGDFTTARAWDDPYPPHAVGVLGDVIAIAARRGRHDVAMELLERTRRTVREWRTTGRSARQNLSRARERELVRLDAKARDTGLLPRSGADPDLRSLAAQSLSASRDIRWVLPHVIRADPSLTELILDLIEDMGTQT